MKKISICITFMLIIGILSVLPSCRIRESYLEFNIKNITDNQSDDYFTSEEMNFAKLENVVFIPEIKAVDHQNYKIYLSAYSKSGEDKVIIKSVAMRDNENILLSSQVDKEMTFEKNDEAVYEGWIDGVTFTKQDVEIADGQEYSLEIEVEITKDGKILSEKITYEIIVKGHKSFVFPT